jgi:hypothetical protein
MLYRADHEGHPESPQVDRIYVAASSLVQPLDRKPGAHVSFEEKPGWVDVGEDLPRFRGKGEERME